MVKSGKGFPKVKINPIHENDIYLSADEMNLNVKSEKNNTLKNYKNANNPKM